MKTTKAAAVLAAVLSAVLPAASIAEEAAVVSGHLNVYTDDSWSHDPFLAAAPSTAQRVCGPDGTAAVSSVAAKFYGETALADGGRVIYDWTLTLEAGPQGLHGTLQMARSSCGPLGFCADNDSFEISTQAEFDGSIVILSPEVEHSNVSVHETLWHQFVLVIPPCQPDSPEEPEQPNEPGSAVPIVR